MAQVTYDYVIRLAEQLTPQEQRDLAAHLQKMAEQQSLTTTEKLALFESMTVDLGEVSPDFSFSREDWYGDGER